jgi:hypothetical protein
MDADSLPALVHRPALVSRPPPPVTDTAQSSYDERLVLERLR